MPQLMPNPALRTLEVFVGEWETQATLAGQPTARGRAVFEWLEGGAFLAQRADAEQATFPTTTMIIGRDHSSETYCLLYFDSRGVSRIYQMSLNAGVWKLWREAPEFSQRFTGTFSDDGTAIGGRWERSSDGTHWEHDFDLTYTRVR